VPPIIATTSPFGRIATSATCAPPSRARSTARRAAAWRRESSVVRTVWLA
jgi:hypothetical protein